MLVQQILYPKRHTPISLYCILISEGKKAQPIYLYFHLCVLGLLVFCLHVCMYITYPVPGRLEVGIHFVKLDLQIVLSQYVGFEN